MTVYAIVEAGPQHVAEMAVNMRHADREEAYAQTGAHPAFGVGASYGSATIAWAGLVDGQVACVFGVSPADEIDGKVGHPWMIGSPLVEKHQKRFLRECREYVDAMLGLYPVLENYVDVRNTTAIRWLRWLGFDILEARPYGPYKMMFYLFRKERV